MSYAMVGLGIPFCKTKIFLTFSEETFYQIMRFLFVDFQLLSSKKGDVNN